MDSIRGQDLSNAPPYPSFRKPRCLWPSCSLQLRLAAVNLECTGVRFIRIKIYWQLRNLPLVTIYTGNYAFPLMNGPCCEGYGKNPDLAYLLILPQRWLEEAVLLTSRPPAFLLFQRSLAHISWCMIIRTLPSWRKHKGLPATSFFFFFHEWKILLFHFLPRRNSDVTRCLMETSGLGLHWLGKGTFPTAVRD